MLRRPLRRSLASTPSRRSSGCYAAAQALGAWRSTVLHLHATTMRVFVARTIRPLRRAFNRSAMGHEEEPPEGAAPVLADRAEVGKPLAERWYMQPLRAQAAFPKHRVLRRSAPSQSRPAEPALAVVRRDLGAHVATWPLPRMC